MKQEYTLTPRIENMLEKRGLSLICERCSMKVKVGQRIVSRPTTKGRVHYHASCWESMFVDDSPPLFKKIEGVYQRLQSTLS